MVDQVKVLIAERNSTELAYPEELALIPANIPFSDTIFTADNVQDAIVEAKNKVSYFHHANEVTQTSTTSTSVWLTHVSLTTSSLPSGDYLLYFRGDGGTSSANREVDVRVYDGTSTLWEIRESIARTQGRRAVSGVIHLASISGVKTYYLQFKVGGTATTAYFANSELLLYRIV
jgi:hypothetical protein